MAEIILISLVIVFLSNFLLPKKRRHTKRPLNRKDYPSTDGLPWMGGKRRKKRSKYTWDD